jgi:hypothetical protein
MSSWRSRRASSTPEPPLRTSRKPSRARNVSRPAWPESVSRPSPPASVSRPAPAKRRSRPCPPKSVSAAPMPRSTLRRLFPRRVSAPCPPITSWTPGPIRSPSPGRPSFGRLSSVTVTPLLRSEYVTATHVGSAGQWTTSAESSNQAGVKALRNARSGNPLWRSSASRHGDFLLELRGMRPPPRVLRAAAGPRGSP